MLKSLSKQINIIDFEINIQDAIKNYFIHGSRSNKKLIPIHSYVANHLKNKTHLKINALPDKEINIIGKYYNKKVDICLYNDVQNYGHISIKFIMSNYSQNSNNYFESLIGELINLKINGLIQWFILIIFDEIPYFDKNGNIKYYQRFNNFSKYQKLVDDKILDFLTIIVINNGKKLIHPSKKQEISYNNFNIIKEYPISFTETSLNFIKKINIISK